MPQIKQWKIVSYLLVFLLISFAGQFVTMLTDYYWFQEIEFTSFFVKSLCVKFELGIVTGTFVWLVLFLNLWIARKISKRALVIIESDATVTSPRPLPQLAELKPFIESLLFLLTFVVAFFVANWAASHWETMLKFLNGVPFGSKDPLFHRDIAFYIFSLPFYRFLYHAFLTACCFSLFSVLLLYLFNNRIYFMEGKIKMAEDSSAHLSVLLGILFLLISFHFHLKSFDLLFSQRELFPGPGYADIHALLPALKVLRFVAMIAALPLIISPWFADKKILFASIVLLAGGTLLARVYAELLQKFEVAPNELAKETPYIHLGIQQTRQAYGISQVQELEFNPMENLTAAALKKNDLTIKNIRLWDHRPLLTTYGQLQEIRTYYDFLDADNDRYLINGEYRQVMLSGRELAPKSLPSREWINEHLTYTHGYGICMGPVNRISSEGLPEFFVKDIPPLSNIDLKVTRPEIYFGESRTNYAIVKTRSKEFDYPAGDENVYSVYGGRGGVPVKNFWRRLLFAIRFGEQKILFSSDIVPESRFLYDRSVLERVSKAAPFLRFDADPYIVVSDEGKLFWLVDGYTFTDRFPYSKRIFESGGFNYIRNSVKATVDAYDGTVTLYIADSADPMVRTYAQIFPKLFHPIEEMPKDLRSHIRYPQTLMNIQAEIYATYHMTDPQIFYNKEDLWKIAERKTGGSPGQVQPYYTITKLAGVGEKEEFILMAPFTPAKKENMISWMAARCDEPNYGKLLVYNFPKQKLVYGPQQIDSRIDQEAEISKQLTLWDQGGSRVLRGSLLVIPVDQSLLYIQPLYLEAAGGGLPELKRIIVAYGNAISMEENLELALQKIFGERTAPSERELSRSSLKQEKETKTYIRQAREHFEKAQRAARNGDWSGYGAEMKAVEKLLERLAE